MKKLLLIVNPRAGQKKAKKYLMDMIDIFNRGDYTVITHITAGPLDGAEALLRYAPEIDLVVCCGGDGTYHEVVSAVLRSRCDIPIGYIPAGSTNDLASSLHLSVDLLEAATDCIQGEERRLDVGVFGERYFSYTASFGAFTRASYATPQNVKNVLGHWAYILSGVQELSQLKRCPLCFTLADGTVIRDEFIFGAVSNSTSVGGVLSLDPERVDMADGLFELLLVRYPKDLKELGDCVRALQQQSYDSPLLSFLSTDKLTVYAPADMPWTLDGEHEPGHEQVELRCLRQAVRVMGPGA